MIEKQVIVKCKNMDDVIYERSFLFVKFFFKGTKLSSRGLWRDSFYHPKHIQGANFTNNFLRDTSKKLTCWTNVLFSGYKMVQLFGVSGIVKMVNFGSRYTTNAYPFYLRRIRPGDFNLLLKAHLGLHIEA